MNVEEVYFRLKPNKEAEYKKVPGVCVIIIIYQYNQGTIVVFV